MPLESAEWITELVETNPVGGDPIAQGDDHIRMLKRVLRDTFPNAEHAMNLPSDLLIFDSITLNESHDQLMIRADTASNSITITLPVGGDVWPGYGFLVKKIRDTFQVHIHVSGGDNINAGASVDLVGDESWALVWASGSTVWTAVVAQYPITGSALADNSVNNAKLVDMAQARIKGRADGAGTGSPTDLTGTQVAAIIDTFTTVDGLAPGASATEVADEKVLRASGAWGFVGAPAGLLVDEVGNGVSGGTFTSGAWQTRVLQTVKRNVNSFVSLAANSFTLPAGTYYVEWDTPAFGVDAHVSRLYNVTDAANVVYGSPGFTAAGNPSQNWSSGQGTFTLAAPKALKIEHICSTTGTTTGFGRAANLGLPGETYTKVRIWRT